MYISDKYIVKWQYCKKTSTTTDNNKIQVNIITKCSIVTNDEFKTEIGAGIAECSHNDQFVKNIGRKISLARALNSTDFTKAQRTVIWELYHHIHGKY
jgi:hypothetical protein